MSHLTACPRCGMENTYRDAENFVCPDCSHEWPVDGSTDPAERDPVVRDANGNPLVDGDAVILIKDLKVKGSSITLKKGTKVKQIRITDGDGDHEVDCRIDDVSIMLKACFLKKA